MSEDNGCAYRRLAEDYLLGAEQEILTVIGFEETIKYIGEIKEIEDYETMMQFKTERVQKKLEVRDEDNLDEVNLRYFIEMARKAANQSDNPGTLASRISATEAKIDSIFGKEE